MDLRIAPSSCRKSALLLLFVLGIGLAPAAQDSYLLGPAPLGGDVRRFDVSPDGHWAVYVDGSVHSVEVTRAKEPRRLDSRPEIDPPGLTPAPFMISPDSRRVVYLAFDGTSRLASAPIDGSTEPVDLLAERGEYAITPDSRTVVLRTGDHSVGDLYSVAIDGGSPAVLLQAHSSIGGFVLTPDSTRVVYVVANHFGEGLVSVAALDGSAPPLVLNTYATTADPSASHLLLIPPDGRFLVYRRGTLQTTGDLFSVPLDGSSSPVQLNAPGFLDVSWLRTRPPRFAPDSRSVAYTEDLGTSFDREKRLFVAPVDGSAPPVAISTSLDTDGVFAFDFLEGGDVLFVHASGHESQLYRCSSGGGEVPQSLSAPIGDGETAWFFKVAPGGTRAVFTGRPAPDAPFELWSVPIDGSEEPIRLSDPGDGGVLNQVDSFGFAQEGRLVLYATDREGDFDIREPSDVLRIWAVPIDGSAPPVRIDGPMGRGGSVRFIGFGAVDPSGGVYGGILFRVAAGGKRLLYLADQRLNDTVELFASPLPSASSSLRSRRAR